MDITENKTITIREFVPEDAAEFQSACLESIDTVAINQLDKANHSGNIGYWVRESLQNQGYARQAVELIKNYGFHQLNLVRLEIVVVATNSASIQVAKNAGAEFECIAKSRLMHEGRPHSAAIYSFTS